MGCPHLLEFNLRHVRGCDWLLWHHQSFMQWMGSWLMKIWVRSRRVAYSHTAAWSSQGKVQSQIYIDTFKAEYSLHADIQRCDDFFLRSKISNLTVVIPAMDHLDKHLATALTRTQYSLSIHSAICIGIKTLNKYYSKMDQSELYCIAMGKCFILLAATHLTRQLIQTN